MVGCVRQNLRICIPKEASKKQWYCWSKDNTFSGKDLEDLENKMENLNTWNKLQK